MKKEYEYEIRINSTNERMLKLIMTIEDLGHENNSALR